MRSATSKTCGMLWLIRMIGRPRFFTSSISSSTLRDSLTPSAAVGSSMMIDPAAEGGGARHRDALALAAGQRLDRLVDVLDGQQAERVEMLARLAAACRRGRAGGRRRRRSGLPPFAAEEEVVGDRQRRRQGEVLVDGLDAGVARLDRRAEVRPACRPAGPRPESGMTAPVEHLDQGRLAGAVVADDAEDLVRHEVEIGVVERDDAAIALDEVARLEDRLVAASGTSCISSARSRRHPPDPLVDGDGDDDQHADGEFLPEHVEAGQAPGRCGTRRRSARRSACR